MEFPKELFDEHNEAQLQIKPPYIKVTKKTVPLETQKIEVECKVKYFHRQTRSYLASEGISIRHPNSKPDLASKFTLKRPTRLTKKLSDFNDFKTAKTVLSLNLPEARRRIVKLFNRRHMEDRSLSVSKFSEIPQPSIGNSRKDSIGFHNSYFKSFDLDRSGSSFCYTKAYLARQHFSFDSLSKAKGNFKTIKFSNYKV